MKYIHNLLIFDFFRKKVALYSPSALSDGLDDKYLNYCSDYDEEIFLIISILKKTLCKSFTASNSLN